jgi:sodium-dependent phosphate transporter
VQGVNYKVHDVLDESHPDYDAHSAAVWDNAEMFDPKTERLFRYLQVLPPSYALQGIRPNLLL